MQALLITDSEPLGGRIRQVLLQEGQDCPTAQVVRLEQAIARLGQDRGAAAGLVVVVLSPDPVRALAVLEPLRGRVQGRVLAVGPTTDSKLVLCALRGGADDYVDEADLETELQAALSRHKSVLAGPAADLGRTIAVLAPSGGSGSSTLAANVATVLAKDHKTSILIDMKLESGDLAALMDLKPNFTLADVCQDINRLDRLIFERTLVRHGSGVHLLAPPRQIADIGCVTAEGVRRVLALARAAFPYVVVDLDHSFREEQVQVLQQCDLILLVIRLEFTALRNARRSLDHMEHLGISRDRVRLVVNRQGQPKEVPAAKAEEALGLKVFHSIPDDPKSVMRANNNGVPVVLEAPSAKVSKSLTKLAEGVNGRHTTP